MKQNMKIAFIGAGNMGGAIISGLIRSGVITPRRIMAADADRKRLKSLASQFKIMTTGDNRKAAEWCDLLVLAVKPQVMDRALSSIGDVGLKPVLSIAAGGPAPRTREGRGGRAGMTGWSGVGAGSAHWAERRGPGGGGWVWLGGATPEPTALLGRAMPSW